MGKEERERERRGEGEGKRLFLTYVICHIIIRLLIKLLHLQPQTNLKQPLCASVILKFCQLSVPFTFSDVVV